MKWNKIGKSIMVAAVCTMLTANVQSDVIHLGGMEVYATETNTTGGTTGTDNTNADATTVRVPSASEKSIAKQSLKDYVGKVKASADEATRKKIDKLYSTWKAILEKATTVDELDKALASAKEAIAQYENSAEQDSSDDGAKEGNTDTTPSSSSDLIMVGGNWVTPVARYGQTVSVVLPIVNMMQGINLNNVIVTPIVAANTSEWPFEIETSGYTQTIPDLPGAGNGQDDMTRRRELTWNFKVKSNVLNGYYKVPFLVNFIDPTTGENVQVTLTTYVLAKGAPGVGNVEEEAGKYSTPRVIVTGYDTEPAEVFAGDTFTLTLHLKNTSVNTSVSNMLVKLSTPTEGNDADTSYSAFMPSSGSNTFYVDKIAKGGTTDLSIEMKAKNDLSQKPYALDISMEYEDENINSYTSAADVSIQVKQNARFEFSAIEILPAQINVGDQANVMFSIYNTGQVTLYNVHVGFEADSIEADEVYLGKIESGGTGTVDTMITGAAATMDEGEIKVVMTYEDENTEKYTYEEKINLIVNDMGPMDDFGGFDGEFGEMGELEEESQGPSKLLIIIIVLVVVVVLLVVGFIILKKRRAKKEEKELVGLLDDIEDIPEDENVSHETDGDDGVSDETIMDEYADSDKEE